MRNTRHENLAEHSHETAVLAHALALIGNTYFNKAYNSERAAVLALFHDANEIMTGDMPTPVKYFGSDIVKAYKNIENAANKRIIGFLPPETADNYKSILNPDKSEAEYSLIKAADKLSALIKCIEEKKAGNSEFDEAYKSIEAALIGMNSDEVNWFMENCIGGYSEPIDLTVK